MINDISRNGRVHFRISPQGKFELRNSIHNREGNVSLKTLVEEAKDLFDSFQKQAQELVDLDNKPAPELPQRPAKPPWWKPVQRWNHPREVSAWQEEFDRISSLPVDRNDVLGEVSTKEKELSYVPTETGPLGGPKVLNFNLSKKDYYEWTYQGDCGGLGGRGYAAVKYTLKTDASIQTDGSSMNFQASYGEISENGSGTIGKREMKIDWSKRTGVLMAETEQF